MEWALLILGGGVIGLIGLKAWQSGGQAQPVGDVVSAQVIGPTPKTPAELLAAYKLATQAEAEKRAFDREHERIVETQSQAVQLPWAPSPPKAPDPPKP